MSKPESPPTPNPTPEAPSSSSTTTDAPPFNQTAEFRKTGAVGPSTDVGVSAKRVPKVGDWVLFRDHDGDRPMMIATVHKDGTITGTYLGASGNWVVRSNVAHDPQKDVGGILIQGMWRFANE